MWHRCGLPRDRGSAQCRPMQVVPPLCITLGSRRRGAGSAGAVPRRKRGGDEWRSLAREQQAQDAGLDDLAGDMPPEAQRSVRQRRNPTNHTDLASVLELIEEVDAAAHEGGRATHATNVPQRWATKPSELRCCCVSVAVLAAPLVSSSRAGCSRGPARMRALARFRAIVSPALSPGWVRRRAL